MDPHLIDFCDGWALWRDVAVRSAGFPVSGLDVFGPGDEPGRLRAVAGDPRFREAVLWQNRPGLHNAVDKVATGSPASGSKQRQREELVASYWQRYCAKNDTIGFFGPLAWAAMVEDGPALAVRPAPGGPAANVHFETWCLDALAEALELPVLVPLGPWPEREVRIQLGRLPEGPTPQRGLDALDRLEARRAAIVASAGDPAALDAALAALDADFEALTARAAMRNPGTMYSARTLVYLDCMRDVTIDIGPAIRSELALTLPALLAGSRWYCGAVFASLRPVVAAVAGRIGNGPLGPVMGASIGALMSFPPAVTAVNADLQQRWASLLADPDVTTLVPRAEAAFADFGPAWAMSVYHAPDVQVAARSAAAVDAGEFLCVVGDFHPGTNTMGQGLFATRHPDHARFVEAWASDCGTVPFLIPPKDVGRMGSRIMPAFTRPNDLHVAGMPGQCMPDGYRVVAVEDLVVEDGTVATRAGEAISTLDELLSGPMFVAGVRAYNPFPVEDHASRITLSKTVLRRETWQVAAGAAPVATPADLAGWAASQGLPRRVFLLSPVEDKPMYVDFESPVLVRIAARMLRRAARERPEGMVRITELLPGPEDCWLEDEAGNRYTSELRLAAVDLERRAARLGQ